MKIIITAKSAAAKAGVLVTPVFSDQLDAPHLREADSKSGGRIAALRANVQRNGVAVESRQDDVFDFLKRPDRPEYDLIILDPPSFTKARGRIAEALRGYRDLHARAAKLLSKNGVLVSFSCSHHVRAHEFEDSIAEGLNDARRNMRLIRRIGQPLDHPVVMGQPETEYLKGVVLEAMPGR